MTNTLEKFAPRELRELYEHGFDEIIDVRSPSEFAIDHIPGAVGRPVLDDTQRAIVGEIYTRQSKYRSKRLGAAFVARNIADILEHQLDDKTQDFRPLIYCWRGGMRSGALAEICRQIGWRPSVLSGGYKTYRRLVVNYLYNGRLSAPVILLDGYTGCAKTAVLARLRQLGRQTIDLEALAKHRGSVFGATGSEQPHQKLFETRLTQELLKLNLSMPVFIEAESSRIGKLNIPPVLWQAMRQADRIVISAPLAARVRHVMGEFAHLRQDRNKLVEIIERLRHYHSNSTLQEWQELASTREFESLVYQLITRHYDPKYKRQSRQRAHERIGSCEAQDLTPEGIQRAAMEIERLV